MGALHTSLQVGKHRKAARCVMGKSLQIQSTQIIDAKRHTYYGIHAQKILRFDSERKTDSINYFQMG